MKPQVTFSIAAVLYVALLPAAKLAGQQPEHTMQAHYTVIDLGTLGGTSSFAGGINEEGGIEGTSFLKGDTQQRAYYWRQGHVSVIPGLGGPNSAAAWHPSDTGQVGAGGDTSEPDPLGEDFCEFGTYLTCHPFVWHRGVSNELPLPAGHNGFPTGFNNHDQVVGKVQSSDPDPTCPPPQVLQTHGIIWGHGKIQTLLQNFPGDMQGAGHAINDLGQVVGWSGSCFEFVSHALLWDNGKTIDLGTISGSNNIAYDINNRTQVVGFSGMADVSFLHAFLWEDGRMRDLGTLPGDVYSQAIGINDLGQVVGGSFDADFNERVFFWQDGQMVDLNTLAPPDSPLFLIEPSDLNSRGEIIGIGFQVSSGEIHGFLAIPRYDDEVHEQNRISVDAGTTSSRMQVRLPKKIRESLKQRLMSRRLGRTFPQ